MSANGIEDQPEQWPLALRLELAEKIEDLGVGAAWRWGTLQALEVDAATEAVESRLGTMACVARGYSHGGDQAKACETALALAPDDAHPRLFDTPSGDTPATRGRL